jgi:hypothetical protein
MHKLLSILDKSRAGPCLLTIFIVLAFAAVALTAFAGTAQAAQSGGTVFPANAWNGMQVTYTIEGASLGTPSDTTPGAINRAVDGSLTSRTLRIYGTIKFGDAGDGYQYSGGAQIAYHKNGDYSAPWTYLQIFWDQGSDGKVATFDLTTDVPSDAKIIYVEINETSYSDKVTQHNLYAGFNLQNPYYAASGTGASATPVASTGVPATAAGSPTASSDGLAFGSPVVALSLLLASGFFAARWTRK